MGIILYMQPFSGPARSVLLTAEAIGLKLQQKIIDLSNQEHLTEEFLKINPQHTIPTLDDNGTILWDSHAINAYLVQKYSNHDSLYPKELAKRAVVDQRLHFDSANVFSWLRYISRSIKFKGQRSLTADQIEGVTDGYGHLENFLKGKRWVTGDNLTIADFSLIANITSLNVLYPVDADKYPSITDWIKRAEALPYYEVNRKGLQDLTDMFNKSLKS